MDFTAPVPPSTSGFSLYMQDPHITAPTFKNKKAPCMEPLIFWRRGRDSNPRRARTLAGFQVLSTLF